MISLMALHAGARPRFGEPPPTLQNRARATRTEGARSSVSIPADGGLSLLRSHLEMKLERTFEAASPADDDVAAQGPDDFYNLSHDVSPDAIADRIVGFAMGFFKAYKAQNPESSAEELVWGFREEVLRGIEEGFSTARQVLSGLDLLEGRVEATVNLTYERVMSRLEEAFATMLFRKKDAG